MTRRTEEEFIKGLKTFFPNYIKGYRDRVNKYYKEQYDEHTAYFPLMNNCSLKSFSFKSEPLFIFLKHDIDEVINIKISDEEEIQFNELSSAPQHLYDQELYKHFNVDNSKILKGIKFYSLNDTTLGFNEINHHVLPKLSYSSGANEANNDYLSYKFNEAIKETVKSSSDYYLFDTEQIIRKVDTESFRYEFEESIKAYNSELYLAAGATAGIALENLLKTILIHHLGIRAVPKRTFIRDFVDVLKTNKIIDERMANRINGFSFIRNSASHTNTGKVKKEDVDQAYFIIKELTHFLS